MKKWISISLVTVTVLAATVYFFQDDIMRQFFKPTKSTLVNEDIRDTPEVVLSNLVTPWSITFLPDGDMLVTERGGQIATCWSKRSSFYHSRC